MAAFFAQKLDENNGHRLAQVQAKPKTNDASYELKPHHWSFLKFVETQLNPYGKTVLEIGGSNFPSDILFDRLGVKKWICVDYLDFWEKAGTATAVSVDTLTQKAGENGTFSVFALEDASGHFNDRRYLKFHGNAGQIPAIFFEQFDIVVSLCAFEHINNLQTIVEKIWRCLKPGGVFYTNFAPIWSSPIGHHYSFIPNEVNFNTTVRDGIPPFIHLLWTEPETREYFAHHPLPYGVEQLEALCHWCYHSAHINRLFYEDYAEIMQQFPWKKLELTPYHWSALIDEKTLQVLQQKYPRNKVFSDGIKIYAVKTGSLVSTGG
ncbi:MAG: class I SAM-dependent methyltransferase [Planctomycetota bacterium]|jgi:SAM-dependent methyltransferase|nr:class I SAM-dependent methyltransferase [Planctomycetota bacterium]